MPCFKPISRQYSVITLRPNSEQFRELWWQFRCEDVIEMFAVAVTLSMLTWIGYLVTYLQDKKDETLSCFLWNTAFTSAYLLTWLAILRCKTKVVYFLPVLFLFQLGMSTISHRTEHSGKDQIEVIYSFYMTTSTLSFFAAFLAPSFTFAIFYIIVFIGASGMLVNDHYNAENDQLKLMVLLLSIGAVGSVVFFYILQKRELKRFLKTMELTESE